MASAASAGASSSQARGLSSQELRAVATQHEAAIRAATLLMRWRKVTRRMRGRLRKRMRAVAFMRRKLEAFVWKGWVRAVRHGKEQRRREKRGQRQRTTDALAVWAATRKADRGHSVDIVKERATKLRIL